MKSGRIHEYEVYAILWGTRTCEERIARFLLDKCDIPQGAIQRGLHLTVYYARRPLPGLVEESQRVHINANVDETRFMVLAPGGENPRPDLEPSRCSVAIRLTRRNQAIAEIQRLRKSVYRLETNEVVGNRTATTTWRNCFGARHYQPHIKLLRPGSEIKRDLADIGTIFRSEIEQIEFGKFQIRFRDKRPISTHHASRM